MAKSTQIYGGPESRQITIGPNERVTLADRTFVNGASGGVLTVAVSPLSGPATDSLAAACTSLTLPAAISSIAAAPVAAPAPAALTPRFNILCGIPEIDRFLKGNGEFGFCEPSFIVLSGPPGIGKTTLLKRMCFPGLYPLIFDQDSDPDSMRHALISRRSNSAKVLTIATSHLSDLNEKRLLEFEAEADVVLRLERGRTRRERVLTCRKNRFGRIPDGRVVFEMDSSGNVDSFRHVIPAGIFKKRLAAR